MNKKMFVLVVVGLMLTIGILSADVPNLIDFQGRITDSAEAPINGPTAITFAIYADSTGGTALWSETQNPVYISNGLFHVFLGAVTPLPEDLFNESNRWIGIEVNSDGEMSPRTRMGSVPYARTDGDWTIDGDNLYSNNSGNVGIGTSNPSDKLEVVGNVEADGFSINGTPVGTSTDSYWIESGNDIYYNSGNVGIGEDNPQAKLDVDGTVAFNRKFLNLDGQPTYTLDPVKSFYFIVPDQSGTGTTLTLADGTAQGQILFIVVSMYNSLTINGANTRLNSGEWEGFGNDTIMLVWAHAWVEISRSNNH